MAKTILVPIDGSEHSRKAIEFAADVADPATDKVCLLYVIPAQEAQRTMVLGAAAISVPVDTEELEAIGEKVLAAGRQVASDAGCTSVETKSTTGDPAAKIVSEAEEVSADMVVMGSRGLSDLAGLFMGSVSHKVTHMAPCTVVSVR